MPAAAGIKFARIFTKFLGDVGSTNDSVLRGIR